MNESAQDIDQLPESWSLCAIDDITTPIAKADPKKEPYRNITYLDISGIDNVSNRIAETKSFRFSDAPSRARQIVKSGDVLFSTVRPYLRNIAQVPAEFDGEIASTGFSILRAAPGIEPSFLYLKALSNQFVDALSGEQYGVSYPAVKDAQVRAQPVAVPPSNEQRRIVEKIEALFAQLDKGEEAVREVQKLLTHYRQSILKSAATGQLTANWRGQHDGRQEEEGELLDRILETRREQWPSSGNYRTPVEPPVEELPELPRGWAWASVDQLLRAGLSNGRSVPGADGPGFPVMRLTALKDGVIDTSERKEGRWTPEEAKPFLVEQGDILVSRGNGSKQLVGRGGLIADPVDPVAYPDTMIRLPISLDHLLPQWFVQLWNSPYMRAQIENAAKTTAGIYKINQRDIRSFVVPLPPLEEQEQIASAVAEEINKTTDLERWCVSELKRSTSLRQSILKEAFVGRLVPQDPTDEPASDLLAHIAADKAPIKKTRRKVQA